MTRILALLLALVLVLPGCKCASQAAIDTVATTAAGNDRYTTLTLKALSGESDLQRDGIEPVSTGDLENTPASVRGLVQRLLDSLHANRVGAHSTLFQLNQGPDPKGMNLTPVEVPAITDENDGLLEDNN